MLITEYYQNEQPMGNYGSGTVNPFIDSSKLGRWVQFRMYGRLASGPSAHDGVIRIWWDGALAHQVTNLDMYNTTGVNYWDQGYLLGWANSGFSAATSVFIDDVKIYDKNPGW